uniref:S-formylglutathione hydrolase n=1 Tax=Phlebotomus papatasi TaxID=29031 RepID=A0A1B0DMJ3_PHLPP
MSWHVFLPTCKNDEISHLPSGRVSINAFQKPEGADKHSLPARTMLSPSKWKNWDATELVKVYNGPPLEVFLDQGDADQFLKDNQLLPDNLAGACRSVNFPFILRIREGYDHSYFYIATFIEEHIRYHADKLQ